MALLVVGLFWCAVTGCTRPLPNAGGRVEPTATPSAQADVEAAATAYVRSHSPMTDFVVERPTVAGDYARVRVLPARPGEPPVWVFLLRQGVNWQGLTLGGFFTPGVYELFGIPTALWVTSQTAPLGGR